MTSNRDSLGFGFDKLFISDTLINKLLDFGTGYQFLLHAHHGKREVWGFPESVHFQHFLLPKTDERWSLCSEEVDPQSGSF